MANHDAKRVRTLKLVSRSAAPLPTWSFVLKATADCRTKNVAYSIECAKCSIQYVGGTENALRIHLTGHRSDIHVNHRRLDRPVGQYFKQLHHSLKDLTITVIEKIYREDANFCKQKESSWIETIKSLLPNGLNRYS